MNDADVVGEIKALSTEREKRYLLSNGMHRAIVYPQPTTKKILPPLSDKDSAADEAKKAKSEDFLRRLLLDYEENLEKSDMSAEDKALNLGIAKMSLQKSELDSSAREVVTDDALLNMWGFTDDGERFTGQNSYVVDNFYRNYPLYFVGISINLASYSQIGIIKNLTLSLTATGSQSCSIYEFTDGGFGSVIANVPDGNTVKVNLNKAIPIARFGEANFAIASSDEYVYDVRYFVSNTCSNEEKRPYLIIDYIPLDEVLTGQKYLECKAGNFLNCNVDILTGVPYFKVPLLNLGGEKLPLSLGFCYDAVDPNTPALGLKTLLGDGWYTNYHQSCYKGKLGDKDCYYYTDANRIKHIFLPAIKIDEESKDLWVDSQGTGLLLEEQTDEEDKSADEEVKPVRIYDETGNSFVFDEKGRLTQINVKQTDSATFVNYIAYRDNTSAAISAITDGMGRVVKFCYDSNGGTISLDGTQKVKFALKDSRLETITLEGATGKITQPDNIQESNAVIEFTMGSDGKILGAKSATGETVTVDYYGKNCVRSIYDPATKLTQNLTYDSFTTTITSNKDVVWVYDFDRRGEFISCYEKYGSGNKGLRFVSREACRRYAGALSEKKDIDFFKGGIVRLGSFGSYDDKTKLFTTSVASLYNFAVFSIALDVTNGYMNGVDSNVGAVVELVDGVGRTLCSIEFEPYSPATQFGAKLFKLEGTNAASKQLRVRITVKGNGTYAFSNAFVTPLVNSPEALCCNRNTGNLSYYHFGDEALYYLGENIKITEMTKDGKKEEYLILHTADYIANERNFYTKTGDTWNMWLDNKRKMIVGVKTPYVDFGNNNGFYFNNDSSSGGNPLSFTVLSIEEHIMNADRQTHNIGNQISISGKDTYMCRILKSYTLDGKTATEHFTKNVYYDKFNRVLRQTDSKQTADYNYSEDGFLLSTTRQDTSDTEINIYESQKYDNGYLSERSNYLLSTVATTKLCYDSMGNVVKATMPDDFEMQYNYYSYGETLSRVKGVDKDSEDKCEVLSDSIINYTDNKISQMFHNSFGYNFTYNEKSDIKKISINDVEYAKFDYVYNNYGIGAYKNGSIVTKAYKNGDVVENQYDKYDRLISKTSGDNSAYYIYADDQATGHKTTVQGLKNLYYSGTSKLYKTIDNFIEGTTLYYYNDYGNISKIEEDIYYWGDTMTTDFEYDDRRRVIKEKYSLDGTFTTVDFTYETGDNAKQYDVKKTETNIFGQVVTAEAERDNLERIKSKTIKAVTSNKEVSYVKELTYAARNATDDAAAGTTDYVSQEKHIGTVNNAEEVFRTDAYEYDINRNISKVSREGKAIDYLYDKANRIIRENNPFLKESYEYSYDQGGNITSKKVYEYTAGDLSQPKSQYVYKYFPKFADRLSSWNGLSMDYDECGNPIVYKGNELVWTRGRLLEQYPLSDGCFAHFSYDANGIRRRKFFFDGYGNFDSYVEYGTMNGKLMYERYCESMRSYDFEYIYYIYNQNEIIGANIYGDTYYYVKNMQGDVIELRDALTGALAAKYEYDAWGNHKVLNPNGTETTDEYFIGNINPFRYRSYYYDTDLKMYYLQTRWYDPEIGRFINLDQIEYLDPETVNGLNLYAYCGNNPVMNTDPDGTLVSTILGAFFGAIWGGIVSFSQGKDVWTGIVAGAVSGALSGFAVDAAAALSTLAPGVGGVIVGVVASVSLGFLGGFVGDLAGQAIRGEETNVNQALTSGGINAVTSLLSFGISSAASKAVGKTTANLFKMLSPEYTPLWSWILQGILTWVFPFLPSIPSLFNSNSKAAVY